jgi:hypothetical protein
VNVEEDVSSCYDSQGNPAPIQIGVKLNRKVFKYDSQGRIKKRKEAKLNVRLKKGASRGSRRSKAQMVRGTSGYETGSQSTYTRQKSLLDYYKMADVELDSHGQDLE